MRFPTQLFCVVLFTVGLRAVAQAEPVVREVSALPFILNSEKTGKPTSKVGYKFEERDFAQTGISIRPDGSVLVDTRFENGKSVEGDHFYCRIELLDAEEKVIAAARQEAALKPGRERTVAAKAKLTPQLVALVKKVRLTYGHFDLTDDNKFWQRVRASAPDAGASIGDFTVVTRARAE